MNWHTPVKNLPLVGPAYALRLEKLNVFTVGDLLTHLPFRYEDFRLISKISQIQAGETVTVIGQVVSAKNLYLKNRRQIQKATLEDKTGNLEITWFNQPYLIQSISNKKIAVSGKVDAFFSKKQMTSPEFEIVKDSQPLLHSGRLVPIYPETAGVSSKWLRSRLAPLLNSDFIKEYLPLSLLDMHQLPNLYAALKTAHFPQSLAELATAKNRLAYDELFGFHLEAGIRRLDWQSLKQTDKIKILEGDLNKFVNSLPFSLTQAQTTALDEILADLAKPAPMNRLLQGDVGSGKTVVAAAAIYAAHLNGFKSVLMAPTEILAEQHYQTLTQLLTPFGIKVGIQTGSVKSIEAGIRKNELGIKKKNRKNHNSSFIIHNSYDVLVGTHALIQPNVNLEQVKLIVIDEQHRFGVRQRAILRDKAQVPHVLTMTATPIPRTVALTIYGDLDLSVIDEMPKNRLPVKTWVVPPQKRQAAYEWIRQQVRNNSNQAFIICPFIEASETLHTVKAAKTEFNNLQAKIFPDLTLGLLHGRLKAAEKNQVLKDFRKQKFDILVSTPVVEVGIDIPDATIILIEAAERFGLAQLHQLRGRVGRSDKQSYCLLFTTGSEMPEVRRLKYMEKYQNGAKLAEFDLKIRGPGQIYGLAQHGRDFFKVASSDDLILIRKTKLDALKLLLEDPNLSKHPLLKERFLSGKIGEVAPD